MLPTVHKHLPGAVVAAFLGLLAAAPAHAAAAPRIKAAYPSDSDRDGHVDGVSLTWTKKVRGGRDTRAPFAFQVAGYKVTSVAAASGKAQRVRVAERRECDAGGSVRVAYRPGGSRVAVGTRGGGAIVRKHAIDMRRFDPPIPRITCAITLDSDRDAHVDGVRLTYSRAVRNRAQQSGKFVFSVTGYRVKAVRAARGRFLTIDVAEKASPDSSATPAITYSRPSRRSRRPYAVRSGRKGDAFSGSFLGTRDGVAPSLVGASTGDLDRDGQLDSMTIRFSEPVRDAPASAIGVLGMTITSVTRDGGGQLVLALAEGTARTDARPGTWIAGDGVRDTAGNGAVRSAVTPADGAAPVMTAAVTQDLGGAPGHIDTLVVGFSEPVAHARDGGGSYPFVVGGRRVSLVEAASGATVAIKLVEASNPDSDERPPVRLIPGNGLPVMDAAGNSAAEGLVNALDFAAPVLLSARTADDGQSPPNGRIDKARLFFSEPVVHESESAAGSFTVAGYTTLAAAAANGDEIGIGLVEGPADDSGATPAVSYRNDGVNDVRDAAGNETPDTSLAAANDGAPPVLQSVETVDTDDDGRIDGLATAWSEPLVHADDSTSPFPLTTTGLNVARIRAAAGANLAIDLVEPADPDTGTRPTITYTGGDAPIRDVAGLEPAKKAQDVATEDKLAPRIVSATTADEDENGVLDSVALRFSENVAHAQESTPTSFAVAGLTVTGADAAVDDTVELQIQETGPGNSGLRPSVTYTPDGQDDVLDAAGNGAPAATIAQATDGARPVLTGAFTADADDDGRLDRVSTSWSEPLDHPDDTTAPFPVSVEQLAVARVRAAVGQTLDVDLTESAGFDTGSAPDLTYDDGSADPIRDAAGLEAAQKVYAGKTRDALPPRLVSTGTADGDSNGKLEAIDIEWSEQVTGSTPTVPYAVVGRTMGPNVSFNGARTRVPFTEDAAQFDTHDTPVVSYDAGPGDLHDVAEGDGDTTEDAPSVAAQAAVDKAPPIIVAAKTSDLSTPAGGNVPNGTIDSVLVTFSEPISHAVDGLAPFSLNVAGRSETDIDGDTGPTDRTLYARVAESGTPDGGEKPNVSTISAGPVADRIKDRANPANEAKAMTFTQTTDEVRPVLMSAQLGERVGGSCTKTAAAGIDGHVDCVIGTWSEDVEHAADASAPYSIASSGWGIPAGGIGQVGPSKTLDIALAPAVAVDRDRSGTTLAYDELNDTPVVDVASPPNESLSGSRTAEPACRDTGLEGNDAQADVGNDHKLTTTSPSFQRKCAFDDDWYQVRTAPGDAGSGFIELATRPSSNVDVDIALFNALGSPIDPAAVLETGAAGQVDRRTYASLNPDTDYFVRVSADESTTPQEGPYCVVFADVEDAEPGCGPLIGQLVFTEVQLGDDWFVEIKNDFDVPVEMDGTRAELVEGPTTSPRRCSLELPTGGPSQSIIDPGEHVIVQETKTSTAFGCVPGTNPVTAGLPTLATSGDRLELNASGSIDVVDFTGVISPAVAQNHSLQFVPDEALEDAFANDSIQTRWCRTFATDTKGSTGDGCDEYRINEVLWRPASTSALSDGKAFVEIAGNIPALPNSELLGGWVVRGVNGLTGDGTSDFVLPATASPRNNGTYVVADGVSGATQVTDFDSVWDGLDLNSPAWPDGTGTFGPRGLQLLMSNPPSAPPCTGSADAFGWTTTAQNFTEPLDDLRSCPGFEGQLYTNSTVGSSAARDNLSSGSDTTYNEARDSVPGDNRLDFCPQASPNPGQLNIRPSC